MENKRYCIKCDTWHELDNFHKNKLKADGLHTYCKDCRSEAMKPYSKEYHKKHYVKRHGKRGRKRKEASHERNR